MARRRRVFLEGVPLHVTFRGNERQDIFRRECDRQVFWSALLDGVRKRGLAVHAYVFMTNHVHLLATPESPESLPGLFRSLGARYVHYFNKYLHRTGSLWEDRYKAFHVGHGEYLLNCMRYIELNPVRAGMVTDPGLHAWSSFRANAGAGHDDLVAPHSTYLNLGRSPGEHRQAYRRLFDPEVDRQVAQSIRRTIQEGWAYGDDEFVVWTGKRMGFIRERRPGSSRISGSSEKNALAG